MTRLEKAQEALRLVNEAEMTTLERERGNVLRLFGAKRYQAEREWLDAIRAEGMNK